MCPTSQPSTAAIHNPCVELQQNSPNKLLSGYYWIQDGSGAVRQMYCNMNNGSCCNSPGIWIRVGYLDMQDSSHRCPTGFRQLNGPRRCGLSIGRYSSYPGCSMISYPTYGTKYERVCGRITAYQKGTTDAFYNHYSHNSSISSTYVDGVSVTYGTNKHHIWTFASALDGMRADQWRCPCSRCGQSFTGRIPSYVGNDYFCDSGTFLFPNPSLAYIANPMWDGSGCDPTSTCCDFNSPPWFCKKLPQATTDDILVRVCRDENSSDEDIQISFIEINIQ